MREHKGVLTELLFNPAHLWTHSTPNRFYYLVTEMIVELLVGDINDLSAPSEPTIPLA